ncbi:hypothetical protein [Thiomicrospira microaerophila]|uniref:hypothetical protein n=1 Tax=Thiomicrospira microaerophila TaxID=406020 RepID=UPI0005CB2902|nr:hypothetical protein [Thiomicrospira microaerophila]
MRKINFVYLKASDNLRELEKEFSNGIFKALSQENERWEFNETIGKKLKNHINVTFFIHRRADFFMSHGVADKNYFFKKKDGVYAVNKFKKLLVPGEFLKRRILNNENLHFREEDISVVGWPRLDKLIQLKTDTMPLVQHKSKKKVLWAPTHSGRQDCSSYYGLQPHIKNLSNEFDFRVSHHPNDRSGEH